MASGSLPVTPKTHRNYVRGAELEEKLVITTDKSDKSDEELCKEIIEQWKHHKGEWIPSSQIAKADAGKIRPTLVPRQIIRDIATVREYGDKKYGSTDNWKEVEIERYRDALCRHLLAYLDDPKGVDEESGIPHYKHMACNMAFICEMETWDEKKM